jgi:hypothetical protein
VARRQNYMVLPYMVASRVVHPYKVVVLFFHPCTMTKWMELLHIYIDLMVPPCIAVEGSVASESRGLWIDREKFLAEEFPPN